MTAIRSATPADAGLILRFIRALAEYEREPDAVKVSEATLRAQLAESAPPFECAIAEHEGTPAGFALYFHTYSTWRGKRGLWLEDLFVLPDFRSHGIGKALLKHVASIARARDCARFEWSVLDWNEPAIQFYRAAGATVMPEWRICRISDEALTKLASG